MNACVLSLGKCISYYKLINSHWESNLFSHVDLPLGGEYSGHADVRLPLLIAIIKTEELI